MKTHWPPAGQWPQEDPESFTTFGRRVATARKAKGLSQNRLSKLVPCSQPLINQIEAGEVADLRSDMMFRLSDVLEVSARWLLWGTGPVHKWEMLSPEEKELLVAYRSLPGPLQEHARSVLTGLMAAAAPPSAANPPLPRIPRHPLGKK